MSVIGLLIGTFFTDFITSFEVYRKNIFKVIVIAFLNNFTLLLAYLLPELLYKIDFIKNKLITPLEYNQ